MGMRTEKENTVHTSLHIYVREDTVGLQNVLNSLEWKWVLEIPGTGKSYKMIMAKKEKGNYNSVQNDTRL